MKQMFFSSAGDCEACGSASWNFSTGSDSPVSAPWLTKRSFAERTRTSPGIMSPAESLTISPGTRSLSGSSLALPSRITVAVTWIMAFSLAAAVSARASCTNRSEALSTTMHAITIPARASPVAKEIDERTASRITNGLRRMIRRRINQPRLRSCATSFGPPVRSRSSASACVRPSGAVCNEPSSASPSFPAASRTAGETRMLWFFAFAAIGDASGDAAFFGWFLDRAICIGCCHCLSRLRSNELPIKRTHGWVWAFRQNQSNSAHRTVVTSAPSEPG